MDGHKYARSHGEWIRVEIGGSPLYEIDAISEMVEFIIPINKACAGDTVEFPVVPAGGYRINTVSIPGATNITNKSENGFGVREYAFTMPSQNVVISATLVTVKFNVTPVQKNIAEGRNTGNGYINVSPLTDDILPEKYGRDYDDLKHDRMVYKKIFDQNGENVVATSDMFSTLTFQAGTITTHHS